MLFPTGWLSLYPPLPRPQENCESCSSDSVHQSALKTPRGAGGRGAAAALCGCNECRLGHRRYDLLGAPGAQYSTPSKCRLCPGRALLCSLFSCRRHYPTVAQKGTFTIFVLTAPSGTRRAGGEAAGGQDGAARGARATHAAAVRRLSPHPHRQACVVPACPDVVLGYQ